MKRFISLLLTVLMIMSAFSFASFADESERSLPFTDVKEGAWYYDGIAFCYDNGIVNGMTDTTFEPNGTLTRAQFVQILAMVDGVDLTEYKDAVISFDDVKTGHWYNAPVCWAVEQGFVAGLSADRFGPNEKITREQLARLLYLYAEYCGCDVSVLADLSGYTDKPSDWAYTQVQWAVAAGIISGTSETTLSPRASATRAQACRMIMSFDDFLLSDKNDVLADLAALIVANSETGTREFHKYGCAFYDEITGIFSFSYRESELSPSGLAVKNNYVYFSIEEYASEYPYWCLVSDMTVDPSLYGSFEGIIGNGYVDVTVDISKGDSEVIRGIEEELRLELLYRIEALLNECGHTLDELFLAPDDGGDADEEIQQLYDALVRYIQDEGVEYPDGKHIGLITNNGNEAYVTEYVPDTGEICLVYVTEPIPGGTDIFDTSYRERVIFIPDILTGSLWWQYTYKSEDGTVKINATGTEADEDVYANLTFEGISEEEAKVKFDTAMENIVLYYLGLMVDAASYITYDAVVDYVNSNGVAFAGGIDLVKDEGDKGYVAEYDPENDDLYIVYVSEPIPGGTDIFDTSYREKAITLINPPLADEYFIYIYESEDGSVKITAEGSYDGYDIYFDNLDLTGISEEEATAKISSALEETMNYFNELISSTME